MAGALFSGLLVGLAACNLAPADAPTQALSTRAASATPGPSLTPGPSPTPAPTLTPTPTPHTLIVCQPDEPVSLYLYGDETAARAGIYAALFDGPVDSVGFAYQPVIWEALPSVENGGIVTAEVEVKPGDLVIDAVSMEVRPLAEGVTLVQPDGVLGVYTGEAPVRTVQTMTTFKLKAGLQWSDGQPLTADDSVFSFEIAASPDTPRAKIFTDRTARYEALDARTVRWTGLPGWGFNPPGVLDNKFFLRFWTPLPRQRYGQLSAAQLLTAPEAVEQPLGWGPFVLTEWVKGDHLTLVRNPRYFRASEGLPKLDKVIFRFNLSPEQTLTELQAGRCHLSPASAAWNADWDALVAGQQAGWLAPQFFSTNEYEHLDFGIVPAEDYERPAGAKVFQDVRVRQAVAYCLDRAALVNPGLPIPAEVPDGYVSKTHPLYAGAGLTVYAYDPARGQALLTEAGWEDQNNDGVRENGKYRLSLTYALADTPFNQQLGARVQTQLQLCGIDIQLKFDTLENLTYGTNSVVFGRRFDLSSFSWLTENEPPCYLYLTQNIASDLNPGGVNATGYSNPAFDAACQAALTAPDEATRRARHAEAQLIFAQDLPSLPLYFRVRAGVALPQVQNYQPGLSTPDLWGLDTSDLWNLEQIEVRK